MDAFTNGRVWHYSSLIMVIGYKRTNILQSINIAFFLMKYHNFQSWLILSKSTTQQFVPCYTTEVFNSRHLADKKCGILSSGKEMVLFFIYSDAYKQSIWSRWLHYISLCFISNLPNYLSLVWINIAALMIFWKQISVLIARRSSFQHTAIIWMSYTLSYTENLQGRNTLNKLNHWLMPNLCHLSPEDRLNKTYMRKMSSITTAIFSILEIYL